MHELYWELSKIDDLKGRQRCIDDYLSGSAASDVDFGALDHGVVLPDRRIPSSDDGFCFCFIVGRRYKYDNGARDLPQVYVIGSVLEGDDRKLVILEKEGIGVVSRKDMLGPMFGADSNMQCRAQIQKGADGTKRIVYVRMPAC